MADPFYGASIEDWVRNMGDDYQEYFNRVDRCQNLILCSDVMMKAFYKDHVPIVRAATYDRVHPTQEFPEWVKYRPHPRKGIKGDDRRPVRMRGSLEVVRCLKPWEVSIALRYLRRIHYCCFDQRQHIGVMENLAHAFWGRQWSKIDNLSLVISLWLCLNESYLVGSPYNHLSDKAWINGKYITGLTAHQRGYLKKLHEILGKIKQENNSWKPLGLR